jgi:cardiolipin synthase C
MAVVLGWVLALVLGLAQPAAANPSLLGSAIGISRETPADPSQGNHVAMIGGGHDALLLRVQLIREARRSIGIQTFIWTNDECGRLLIHELVEAARRGVKVRIIADHFASDQDPEVVAFLATVHPNLELKHYRPAMSRIKPSRLQTLLAGLLSFRAFNQRMHNKVMLVDGQVVWRVDVLLAMRAHCVWLYRLVERSRCAAVVDLRHAG